MCGCSRQTHWETQHCVINICYHNRGQSRRDHVEKAQLSPDPTEHCSLPGLETKVWTSTLVLDQLPSRFVTYVSYDNGIITKKSSTLKCTPKYMSISPTELIGGQYRTVIIGRIVSLGYGQPPIYLCFLIR